MVPKVPNVEIWKSWKEGLTPNEIAKKYNVTRQYVYDRLSALGLPSNREPSCEFKIDDETLIDLVELGWSDSDIAKVFKMHVNTILKRRRRLGLKSHPHKCCSCINMVSCPYFLNGQKIKEIQIVNGRVLKCPRHIPGKLSKR